MRLLVSTLWHHLRKQPHLLWAYAALTGVLIVLWVAEPLLGASTIDALEPDTTLGPAFFRDLGLWVGVSLVLSLVQAAHKMVCWRMNNRMYMSILHETYGHILALDIAFHIQQRAGGVIKKMESMADTLWETSMQIMETILPSTVTALVFFVLAYTVSPTLTALVFLMLLVYLFLLVRVIRWAAPMQAAVSRVWVGVVSRAQDVATNIVSVKSAGSERRELDRMRRAHGRAFGFQCRVDRLWGLLEALNIYTLVRILIVGLGLWFVSQGNLSLGELFFFLFITYRLLSPIEIIGAFLPKWNEKMEKLRMGVALTRVPAAVATSPEAKIPQAVRGEVRFENVSFAYDQIPLPPADSIEEESEHDSDLLDPHQLLRKQPPARGRDDADDAGEAPAPVDRRDVIRNLTLSVRPGEHVALVGHSGAGKSTIAMLLNRFYDVTEGAILVDGTDLRDLEPEWWRGQIGLVLQENIMFHDSVLNNIRYARPDATAEEVIDAATRASAHEFIERLPEGYHTVIGERGFKLSGGQRQRVAIARAILKKPSVVILDEATSALDSITERDVQRGIQSLIDGRTSFIIAHRLSTVRAVDRIAVMEDGRLRACATHDELMETCETYRRMVELQQAGMLKED